MLLRRVGDMPIGIGAARSGLNTHLALVAITRALMAQTCERKKS